MRDLHLRLRPSPRQIGRDPRRNAADPAQSLVLPAADAGLARCDRRATAGEIRRRFPAALPASKLDRVILDRRELVRRDALDLVFGAKLEIARVMALVELLTFVAAEL